MLNPEQSAPAVSFLPDTASAAPAEQGVANPNETAAQAQSVEPQAPAGQEGQPEEGGQQPTPEQIQSYLDSLPAQDQKFLMEHMTPEFIHAIELISGTHIAQYLSKFVDPEKVMVPVPRKLAEEYLAAEQAQKQGAPAPQGQPQGSPNMAPPQAAPQPQAQPAQGVMAPPAQPQQAATLPPQR